MTEVMGKWITRRNFQEYTSFIKIKRETKSLQIAIKETELIIHGNSSFYLEREKFIEDYSACLCRGNLILQIILV